MTTVGGRIARANDGDHGSCQDLRLAQHGDHRWRVIECGERARVIRFDERDQPAIQSLQLCEFALGGAARMNLQRLCAPAPVSKIRQCRQRACGGSEAGEQMAKRDRSDILGPDQAQPIKPFDAGEFAFRRGHDATPPEWQALPCSSTLGCGYSPHPHSPSAFAMGSRPLPLDVGREEISPSAACLREGVAERSEAGEGLPLIHWNGDGIGPRSGAAL